MQIRENYGSFFFVVVVVVLDQKFPYIFRFQTILIFNITHSSRLQKEKVMFNHQKKCEVVSNIVIIVDSKLEQWKYIIYISELVFFDVAADAAAAATAAGAAAVVVVFIGALCR